MMTFTLYPELQNLLLVALLIVLLVCLSLLFQKKEQYKEPTKKQNKKTVNENETCGEVDIISTLELMRDRNIIDQKEFNQLIVKAMPHIK